MDLESCSNESDSVPQGGLKNQELRKEIAELIEKLKIENSFLKNNEEECRQPLIPQILEILLKLQVSFNWNDFD